MSLSSTVLCRISIIVGIFSQHYKNKVGVTIIPILQIRKLRFERVKWLTLANFQQVTEIIFEPTHVLSRAHGMHFGAWPTSQTNIKELTPTVATTIRAYMNRTLLYLQFWLCFSIQSNLYFLWKVSPDFYIHTYTHTYTYLAVPLSIICGNCKRLLKSRTGLQALWYTMFPQSVWLD